MTSRCLHSGCTLLEHFAKERAELGQNFSLRDSCSIFQGALFDLQGRALT